MNTHPILPDTKPGEAIVMLHRITGEYFAGFTFLRSKDNRALPQWTKLMKDAVPYQTHEIIRLAGSRPALVASHQFVVISR